MSTAPTIEKRFIFHGNSVAFAAHVRRPQDFFIPAVASSCLPVTGGIAEASSGPQRYGEIMFESAHTRAHGDYADVRRAVDFTHGNFADNMLPTNTFVESTLRGLRIEIPQPAAGDAAPTVRRLHAHHLHVRLESSSDRRTETAFRSMEATLDGIEVDGHRLIVETNEHMFSQHDTYAKLRKAYEEDAGFRDRYGKCFYPSGQEKTGWSSILSKHEIPSGNGTVVGTIVTGLRWENERHAPDTTITGNRLAITGIGTLFFGEIMVQEGSRRVTLLRCQLGSPDGADLSACEVQSNGEFWPTG